MNETEAKGIVAMGRSAFLNWAMQAAADKAVAEHNARWEAWRNRENQEDGAPAPVITPEMIRDAKIAARSAAKGIFTDALRVAPPKAEPNAAPVIDVAATDGE